MYVKLFQANGDSICGCLNFQINLQRESPFVFVVDGV